MCVGMPQSVFKETSSLPQNFLANTSIWCTSKTNRKPSVDGVNLCALPVDVYPWSWPKQIFASPRGLLEDVSNWSASGYRTRGLCNPQWSFHTPSHPNVPWIVVTSIFSVHVSRALVNETFPDVPCLQSVWDRILVAVNSIHCGRRRQTRSAIWCVE